jgi:cell division protein FtsW (lipid II flippase)
MNTRRTAELRYLLPVFLVVSLGFLILANAFVDKGIQTSLIRGTGIIDIAPYTFPILNNALIPVYYVAAFVLFHLFLRFRLPEADPLILPVVALLSGIGLIIMLRLSPDLAIARNDWLFRHPVAVAKDNVMALAKLGFNQVRFIGCGILMAIITILTINLQKMSAKKYIWVLVSVLLTVATLLFGTTINGKKLWIIGLQPIEFIKLLLLFFLGGYIYEHGKGIEATRRSSMASWLRFCGPLLVMFVFAMLPILLQIDLGPSFILLSVFLLMFHYAGNKPLITLIFIVIITTTGYLLYRTNFPPIIHERFVKLFDPFGRDESLSRALWCISSGGFFGTGIGYGEPQRIAEVQSDFVFAAICQETGLLGAVSVVLAYVVFIVRCIKIASVTANTYKKALVVGVATLFAVQAFVIMAGNLIIVPLTGITMPLAVSYGGSSIIANFIAVGIVLKISGEPS